jgi:phage terminase large subunit-like protein
LADEVLEARAKRDPWARFKKAGAVEGVKNPGHELTKYVIASTAGSWAIDPNNAQNLLESAQAARGEDYVITMAQTPRQFNEPIEEFRAALNEGRVSHAGDPLLTWALQNLETKKNGAGQEIPSKPKHERKIDPAVALLMAFRMALFAEVEEESVYNTRGILTL